MEDAKLKKVREDLQNRLDLLRKKSEVGAELLMNYCCSVYCLLFPLLEICTLFQYPFSNMNMMFTRSEFLYC